MTPAPVYVHIHAPQPEAFGISRVDCPTCKKRSYSVWRFTPWYGSDSTCMRCGEEWTEEGRCERPFMRGWRKQNIDNARKLWKRLNGTPSDTEG